MNEASSINVDDVALAPFDAVVHQAAEGMADLVESLSAVVRARAEGAGGQPAGAAGQIAAVRHSSTARFV